MTRRWSIADGVIALAFVAAAVLVWWYRIIAPAMLHYDLLKATNGDVSDQIYPMAFRAAEWMRAGHIPLWNPYQSCGHPFLATGIYGALYPFNVFYLLLPTELGVEVTVVLHLALSAVLMYAYARAIDLPRFYAFTAAIIFSWSGFMVTEATWFPPALSAAVWLPLALLAVEKAVQGPRPVWAVILALAVSLSFLAGWPQTWIYTMYAIAVYAAVRITGIYWMTRDRRRLLGIVVCLGGGAVLALGIMAIQFLPTYELQRLGPRRAGGLTEEQATLWTPRLSPLDLHDLAPQRAGELTAEQLSLLPTRSPACLLNQAFDSLPEQTGIPYIGIATLLLIAMSPFGTGRKAQIASFWILAIFSLGVALGVGSPFFTLHRILPGMAEFRNGARRVLYLYAFSASPLGAIGLHALGSARPGRKQTMMLVLLAMATLAFGLVFTSLPRERILTLAGALMAGAIALTARLRARQVISVLLIAMVSWDLFHAARNQSILRPFHDVHLFDEEEALLGFVKEHQDYGRTYIYEPSESPWIMEKQATLRGIYSITDYEPLSLMSHDLFFRRLESPRMHRPSAITFTGKVNADPAAPGFGLIDLMSVRYLVVRSDNNEFLRALGQYAPKWRPVPVDGTTGRYVLYENTNALPRAYVAQSAEFVSHEEQALEAVASPAFNPRAQVVVEGAPASTVEGADARTISPAEIIRYDPTEVVVDCRSEGPGYLVLTDTFYPGWRATVDGKAAPILGANYLFRAVAVGDGRHEVTFSYAPTSFRFGAIITAVTVATMLLLAAYDWTRRKRRAPMAH